MHRGVVIRYYGEVKEKLLIVGALFVAVTLIGIALSMNSNNSSLAAALVFEAETVKTVSATDFKQAVDDSSVIVLDVRTPEEYNEGHIARSSNIDFYSESFVDRIATLDKKASYAVYCRSGNRSEQTLSLMKEMGFEKVLDLSGGIGAWQRAGYTLE